MANFSSYGGMRFDCLHTRYEGHVGNRNPILGTGHTATDEPNCDIEGRKGPGTRGPKHLKQYQDWQTRGVNAPHQRNQQHANVIASSPYQTELTPNRHYPHPEQQVQQQDIHFNNSRRYENRNIFKYFLLACGESISPHAPNTHTQKLQ